MPSIYVASLTDYNNGILHGEWIEVDSDSTVESIQEEITKLLGQSPTAKQEGSVAEEWAIHDYEGFLSERISEHQSLDSIVDLAVFIDQCSREYSEEACSAWLGNGMGPDMDAFRDSYLGQYEDLGAYAEETCEGMGDIPKWLQGYVNWDAMGRDMELNGDIWAKEVGYKEVHVFHNL